MSVCCQPTDLIFRPFDVAAASPVDVNSRHVGFNQRPHLTTALDMLPTITTMGGVHWSGSTGGSQTGTNLAYETVLRPNISALSSPHVLEMVIVLQLRMLRLFVGY